MSSQVPSVESMEALNQSSLDNDKASLLLLCALYDELCTPFCNTLVFFPQQLCWFVCVCVCMCVVYRMAV